MAEPFQFRRGGTRCWSAIASGLPQHLVDEELRDLLVGELEDLPAYRQAGLQTYSVSFIIKKASLQAGEAMVPG